MTPVLAVAEKSLRSAMERKASRSSLSQKRTLDSRFRGNDTLFVTLAKARVQSLNNASLLSSPSTNGDPESIILRACLASRDPAKRDDVLRFLSFQTSHR